MYVITNREIHDNKTSFDRFGDRPNARGPNELRLAEIHKTGQKKYRVHIMDDELQSDEAAGLIEEFDLDLNPADQHYASLKVACDLMREARDKQKSILLFVHGFNNNVKDAVERGFYIQEKYGVEVVLFSWPANGGGARGVASYLSDKGDARISHYALDRTLGKINFYLCLLTEGLRRKLWHSACGKYPENAEMRDAIYAELLKKKCDVSVNAMFHSMGNYLLKHMLKCRETLGNKLTFDNITLCQADANNLDHSFWVERLRFRNRLFITLNESDYALKAARMKGGSEQLARLGHYPRELIARNAFYVNLSDMQSVNSSHAPFGEPAEQNKHVRQFFNEAFNGMDAEKSLKFYPQGNWFSE